MTHTRSGVFGPGSTPSTVLLFVALMFSRLCVPQDYIDYFKEETVLGWVPLK